MHKTTFEETTCSKTHFERVINKSMIFGAQVWQKRKAKVNIYIYIFEGSGLEQSKHESALSYLLVL